MSHLHRTLAFSFEVKKLLEEPTTQEAKQPEDKRSPKNVSMFFHFYRIVLFSFAVKKLLQEPPPQGAKQSEDKRSPKNVFSHFTLPASLT